MSIITIQCRLVAKEETLRHLWELMTQKNTLLINEVLEQIGNHPELEEWIQKGKLPTGQVKTLCNSLKTDLRFSGQPGRFYSSAISLVYLLHLQILACPTAKTTAANIRKRTLAFDVQK